jgi:hypothetical protein
MNLDFFRQIGAPGPSQNGSVAPSRRRSFLIVPSAVDLGCECPLR